MLGVRLDLGFTLSKEKSLLELVQKALNAAMSCLSAVESVFADAEPLVSALHRGEALMRNIASIWLYVKVFIYFRNHPRRNCSDPVFSPI